MSDKIEQYENDNHTLRATVRSLKAQTSETQQKNEDLALKLQQLTLKLAKCENHQTNMQREKEMYQLLKEDMLNQKKAFFNQEARLEVQLKSAFGELEKVRE